MANDKAVKTSKERETVICPECGVPTKNLPVHIYHNHKTPATPMGTPPETPTVVDLSTIGYEFPVGVVACLTDMMDRVNRRMGRVGRPKTITVPGGMQWTVTPNSGKRTAVVAVKGNPGEAAKFRMALDKLHEEKGRAKAGMDPHAAAADPDALSKVEALQSTEADRMASIDERIEAVQSQLDACLETKRWTIDLTGWATVTLRKA